MMFISGWFVTVDKKNPGYSRYYGDRITQYHIF